MAVDPETLRQEIRTFILANFLVYGWIPYPTGPTDGDKAEIGEVPDPLTSLESIAPAVVQYQLADAIAKYRDNKGGCSSTGELLEVSGITREKFKSLEDQVTVRSNVFRILSRGESASGLARGTIECVVDRGSDVPRILYWRESSP